MAVRTGGGSFTGLTAEQQADVLAFLLGAQPDAESRPNSSGASTGDPTSPQEVAAQGSPTAAPTGFFRDVIDGFVVGGMIKGKDTWGIALGEFIADFTPWSKAADARNAAAAAKSVWDGDPDAAANVGGVAMGALPGGRIAKKAAGKVMQAGGWVAGKIKGAATGLWDRFSGQATKGAGAAGEGTAKAVAPSVGVHAPNKLPIPQGHTRVYRAVSEAEYQDVLRTGQLRQGPNSMEGKWFADSLEGAQAHGRGQGLRILNS